MKFFTVIRWVPINHCIIASSEEEAFKKAEALPFDSYDESTLDDLNMAERGGVYDWDELVVQGYADPHSEFYIDEREVTEQEFREFGSKHLVTYQTTSPKKPDSELFAVSISTKNIYVP